MVNSFFASGDLSTADNLCKQIEPGHVWPDLDANCLTLIILEIIF